MNSQSISDQKDLPPSPLDQLFHEGDQHLGAHRFFVNHEANFPLLGDRGEHVDRGSFRREANHRRLAFRGIAASMLPITAYPRLIAAMNLRLFLLGSLRHGHILFVEPVLDCGWALFIGVLHRLLGGAPTAAGHRLVELASEPHTHIE